MKKELSASAAVARLEELCARSEQCSYDLRQKLRRWGVAESHDDIIDRLIDARFVDDERFARAYVRDKYRFERWGRMKIARGLAAKRIARPTIEAAFGEIDPKEYARNCYRCLAAKLRKEPADAPSYETRQRMLRFGLQRGYEPSLMLRLIENPRLWDGRLG